MDHRARLAYVTAPSHPSLLIQDWALMTAAAISSEPRRDAAVISVVSGAHLFSHFYMFLLAPLFPVMRAEFGVSAVELGAILTTYSVASGTCQYFMGRAVDRFGAVVLLIVGLILLAGGFGLMGLASSYWMLLPLAAIAGVGNSVFHPADYTILGNTISEKRMGRAFGIHTFSGWVGWAAALVAALVLDNLWGWRVALLSLGTLGLGYAGLLYFFRPLLTPPEKPAAKLTPTGDRSGLKLVFSLPILCMLVFFIVTAAATNGLTLFLPTLMLDQGFTRDEGTWISYVYVITGAFGVLAGGILADRMKSRELLPTIGLIGCGSLLTLAGLIRMTLPVYMVVFAAAGFMFGMIAPSRDLIVRSLAPEGKSGQVFGFVSTGLDIGGALLPLLFGLLIDHGMHAWVFYSVGILMVVALAAGWFATFAARHAAPVQAAAE
jgi:FSR family fosmidomycin resistance protein-like MFS transporter